jgi:hypothetical protein
MREPLLLRVDSVQCNTRERNNDIQRLRDVGWIHWNRGRGEAATHNNSRRRMHLSAGLRTC